MKSPFNTKKLDFFLNEDNKIWQSLIWGRGGGGALNQAKYLEGNDQYLYTHPTKKLNSEGNDSYFESQF